MNRTKRILPSSFSVVSFNLSGQQGIALELPAILLFPISHWLGNSILVLCLAERKAG